MRERKMRCFYYLFVKGEERHCVLIAAKNRKSADRHLLERVRMFARAVLKDKGKGIFSKKLVALAKRLETASDAAIMRALKKLFPSLIFVDSLALRAGAIFDEHLEDLLFPI